MPSFDTLTALNDALTRVWDDLSLSESLDVDDDTKDSLLDDATHAVAHILWPDE